MIKNFINNIFVKKGEYMTVENISLPYEIDMGVFKRFDQRKTVFGRIYEDENALFYGKDMYDNVEIITGENKKGYGRLDFARAYGSWAVYNHFAEAFGWDWKSGSNATTGIPKVSGYKVDNPEYMSEYIKETAKMFGAYAAGISILDRKWVYSHNYDGIEISIPEEFRFSIVFLIKMEIESLRNSPDFTACLTTGKGYSMMAFVGACLSETIRNLGYRAISMGNDTALSIPLAVDAGLGELGRNGLLITPDLGSSVRIGKIFTDMPLYPDKPVNFGVKNTCRNCMKCAKECEVDAISKEIDPIFETVTVSNNEGIKRWPVNHDKCYSFWVENGGECSTCISVCPFANRTK